MIPDLQYYMIDFCEPTLSPELFRAINGQVLNVMVQYAHSQGWMIVPMGDSRPSGQQMNAKLQYPARMEDGR